MIGILVSALLSICGCIGLVLVSLVKKLFMKIERLETYIHDLTIEIERLKK